MNIFSDFFQRFSDLPALVQWAGYVGLSIIIFAETGLLVGFFLPGDSLLVTAGLLASQGYINVYLLGVVLTIAAIVGDSTGYAIGHAAGPRLFTRDDSLLFKKKHLLAAADFYNKHGGKTIIIARFMPLARTFVPVVAGAAAMSYRRFWIFNAVGAISWVWSMLLIGYVLGRYVPGVASRIDVVILVVILLSFLPAVIHWLRRRAAARAARAGEVTR